MPPIGEDVCANGNPPGEALLTSIRIKSRTGPILPKSSQLRANPAQERRFSNGPVCSRQYPGSGPALKFPRRVLVPPAEKPAYPLVKVVSLADINL